MSLCLISRSVSSISRSSYHGINRCRIAFQVLHTAVAFHRHLVPTFLWKLGFDAGGISDTEISHRQRRRWRECLVTTLENQIWFCLQAITSGMWAEWTFHPDSVFLLCQAEFYRLFEAPRELCWKGLFVGRGQNSNKRAQWDEFCIEPLVCNCQIKGDLRFYVEAGE